MRILHLLSLLALNGALSGVLSAVELESLKEYHVVTMNGQPVLPMEGFTPPTMTLDLAEKRLAGTSGINRYGGGFTMKDGVLTIGQPFSTLMAGPEAAMKAEQDFLEILTSPLTITTDAKGLVLTGAKGSLLISETVVANGAEEPKPTASTEGTSESAETTEVKTPKKSKKSKDK